MNAPVPPDQALACEHALLLRHWAGVQNRVSAQVADQCRELAAQQRRCERLEAELMRWRTRWLLATTQMLWGLGWPQLGTPAPASPADEAEAGAPAPLTARDLLCQSACAGHAHPWLDEQGQCRLHGHVCERVAPTTAPSSTP